MKKRLLLLTLVVATMTQVTACGRTCKYDGCDNKDIYEDGYCQYHYYLSVGQDYLEDLGGALMDGLFNY